jgi:TRAP-type C4-dicarboxylate transport system permease small subunit
MKMVQRLSLDRCPRLQDGMASMTSDLESLMGGSGEDVPGLQKSRWVTVPNRVSDVFTILAGVGILGLMFITVIDVFLRQVLGGGLGGAIEISEVLLVCVVFLGMMAGEMTNTHVRTPVLTERVGDRAANVMHAIGFLPAVVFLGWMTYLTALEAIHSVSVGEFRFGVVFVPVWPAKIVIPIGLAGLTVAVLIKFVTAIVNVVKHRTAEVSDHESFI